MENLELLLRFDSILGDIENIKTDGYGKMYRSILYFSLIDIISTIYLPKQKNSGPRFKRVIEKLSDWREGQRVCLILLWKFIHKMNDARFEDAQSEILNRIYKFPQRGELITLKYDMTYKEVIKVLEGIEVIGKRKVRAFRHIDLLWESRNAMIHTLTPTPWESIDLFEGSEPYYMRVNLLDLSDKKISGPIYPVGFLKKSQKTV